MKLYREFMHIGKAKYVVSYHDGVKKHDDGSNFFDIQIFKNRPAKDQFVQSLVSSGYVPQGL